MSIKYKQNEQQQLKKMNALLASFYLIYFWGLIPHI